MATCAVVHGPETLCMRGLLLWEETVVMVVGWGTKPGRPSRTRCGPKKKKHGVDGLINTHPLEFSAAMVMF